jgi:hypothetical protein
MTGADILSFFNSANRALKDGGLLLFDVSSAYKLEHTLGGHTFGEDLKDCTYLWQNVFDPASKLLEMRLVFFLPGQSGAYRRFDERHVQKAHDATELSGALRRAGFLVEGVFDAFTRQSPKPESERIQFIARKKRPF